MAKYAFAAVVAIVGIALIGIASRSYFAADLQTVSTSPKAITPVVVAPVTRTEVVDKIEAIGTARANESITITAHVTETVRHINFDDGIAVDKGDILVELTSAEEDAQLREIQVTLDEAEKQLRRVTNLVKRGLTTQAELDEQRAERDRLQAQLDAIQARLADRLISAPFTGILGFRAVSPGALITPGTAITTLDDISVIKLDFPVPEAFLASLKVGQDVIARSVAYPGRLFRGRVSSIASRVDPVTRAVTVRAALPNPDKLLKPGKFLTVELIKDRRQSLMIPEEALVPVSDRQFVFLVNDDKTAAKVAVDIGRRRTGIVEILSGLSEAQHVVIEGTNRIDAGSLVEIQEIREKPAK